MDVSAKFQPAHVDIQYESPNRKVSNPVDCKKQAIARCETDNNNQPAPSAHGGTSLRRRRVVAEPASTLSVNNVGHDTDRAVLNDDAIAESDAHTDNAENSMPRGSSDANEDGCTAGSGIASSANRLVAGFAGMAGSTAVRAIRGAVDLSNPFNVVTTVVQHAPALLSAVADDDSHAATLAKYSAMAMTGAGIATSLCAAASATSAISAAAILGTCGARLVGQIGSHIGVRYLLYPRLPDSVREYAAPWLHAGTEIALAAASPIHTRTPDGTDHFAWPGGRATCGTDVRAVRAMGYGRVDVPSPEVTDLPPAGSAQVATPEAYNEREFMNGVKIFNRNDRVCITANTISACFEPGDQLSVWSTAQTAPEAGDNRFTELVSVVALTSHGSLFAMAGQITVFDQKQLHGNLADARDQLTIDSGQPRPDFPVPTQKNDGMRTVNYYPQGDTEGWVTIAGEDAGEENHCLRYQLFLAEPLNSHNPFLKKYADDHDRRMPADGFFRLAQVLNGNGAMTPALVQQAFVDVVVPGANIADYFASPVIQNKLDPARLASQLGDSSTLLILNPSRLTSDQPIVPESESVILFSIDSKQKSVLTIIGSDGFVAESEVVRHRSVRSAGDPSVANRYEIMASLPGWIGGTTTLSVGNRTGTLDVLIKTDGDFGMDFLDNLSNTGNLLTDMAKYLFKYLESASPSDGYETKWRRIYALEEELYREDYDWLNIDGEPRDYMSLVLLTARFINNSHKWWLKPESVNLFLILNEYEDIPNRNVGYSRPAIQLCLTNSEMSYAIVQELYTPLSPPSNILNCFTGIANTPFGDIPGMPDWFGGEVTLTTGVRTGTFTVFIKNDDSPFGEQMQNSLCTDNDRIRGAARYLFAKLEGTSDVDPGFLSTPSWLVSGSDSSIDVVRHVTDFNINDDLKDHEILNPMLDSRLHYELVDQEKPVTALHKVRLKMVMVLNESSSSFGMNLKTITRKGKSLGYGRPAVSLLIGTTERNNFHKGTNRTTEYIIEQYRGCKNIYINGGFNLDFLVSDIYADGWFSPSLKISISDTVKMTVTGHLSSSSDLRKSRLTSTELIQTAVQNLHTFVTTTPDDTSSFIQIPNFSDKLLMSIKNDERPISLDQGGIINRLILYAGNTPVFGKPLAAVVVDMNSSVYDNAISFIFYSRLKIIPPPGKTVTSFC